MKEKELIVISGPCSAETEEQVFKTVEQLSVLPNLAFLRAGIWKPRTRPNMFEGVGEVGLKWLVDAGKHFDLKTSTEVANAQHVEKALKAGIDVLWIGARTTVNPFSVQEIADSLKGVNVPVYIKNPVNPDLNLWIGAVERIKNVGIENVSLIHRGFSTYGKSIYRNEPMWEAAIEMMRLFPELTMICDPSHISGKRELLQQVSQKALDLDMDGLMIESHITPNEAWSDAQQQVTPADLQVLLGNLSYKKQHSENTQFISQLEQLRSDIDVIDERLIRLLSERMDIVEKIGLFKKENNITVFQVERWKEILDNRSELARLLNLDNTLIEEIFKAIHKASVEKQSRV
ncbi:MAG: chorismate mutase [Bacteroidia bacterium]